MKHRWLAAATAIGCGLALSGCVYDAQPPAYGYYDQYDPGQRAVAGGLVGAGAGAALGGMADGGRGAAVGALAGGAVGAVAGASTTPPAPYYDQSPPYYEQSPPGYEPAPPYQRY